MPLAGVEPTIAASERRQTHVLDHAVTEMGWIRGMAPIIKYSALNIEMLSAWGPGRFEPEKIIHGTISVKGRVGFRCDKDVGRRK